MITTLIAFTIVLGILIFFHELGHFLLAKLSGVSVQAFSLGFGPAIFSKTIGETEYRLAAIPLGGYVKMLGEHPEEDDEAADYDPERSFANKPLYARASIVAAGPIFNLVLAILIFTVIAWSGIETISNEPIADSVQADTPAYTAGIMSGDKFLSINGAPIAEWSDISKQIQAAPKGEPLAIEIERNGTIFNVNPTPAEVTGMNMFGEEIQRLMIGIAPASYTKRYGFIEGIGYGFEQTWWVVEITGQGVKMMIDGRVSVQDSLGGPIMIADMSGQAFKAGATPFFGMIAIISVSLALINLLPIPVLDGGHLFFFLIEAIIRRPLADKPREIAQQIGLFLLIFLMLFAIFNDIMRLIGGAQ